MDKQASKFHSQKGETDIVAVITGKGVILEKAGKELKACCPFHHEKSPSFFVNPDHQTFRCFGCGAAGDVIDFMTWQADISRPEALKQALEFGGR